jgi:hypothetical protein
MEPFEVSERTVTIDNAGKRWILAINVLHRVVNGRYLFCVYQSQDSAVVVQTIAS